jgi:hypothetical protein
MKVANVVLPAQVSPERITNCPLDNLPIALSNPFSHRVKSGFSNQIFFISSLGLMAIFSVFFFSSNSGWLAFMTFNKSVHSDLVSFLLR